MLIKKIHQIWVGPKIPESYKNYMIDIKLNHPDYEYIFWDDDMINQYFKDDEYINLLKTLSNFENIPKAFLSNYYRLRILQNFGGWYIDSDCEFISTLDNIEINDINHINHIIVGYMSGQINNGVIYFNKSNEANSILNELINIIKFDITDLKKINTLFEDKDNHKYTYNHLNLFRDVCYKHPDHILCLPNNYFFAVQKKDAIILHHKCYMSHLPANRGQYKERFPN